MKPASGMTRRRFLQTVAVGTAAGLLPSPARAGFLPPAPGPRNVVLLIADQHRYDGMGWRDPSYSTPAMDRFAAGAGAVRFTNCFTAAPLCAPARAALFTGRTPHETSIAHNKDVLSRAFPTLGDLFHDAGYQTAYFGKWHLGGNPDEYGFDVARLVNIPQADGERTRLAIEHLHSGLDPSRPFFLVLSWDYPHPPYVLVDRYKELFDPRQMPIPPSFTDTLLDKPLVYRRLALGYGLSRAMVREMACAYRTMVRDMDDHFGRMTEALKAGGLDGTTVVAYVSDHGEMLGAHHLRAKKVAFEESIRVPFMLRVPGVSPARHKVDDLVSGIDVPGTLLQAAGLEVPVSYTGRSVYDAIFRSTHPNHETIFFEFARFRGIRTRNWKYVKHYGDIDELYDLENDPLEMKNLAGDAAYGARQSALSDRLEEWWLSTGGTPRYSPVTSADRG